MHPGAWTPQMVRAMAGMMYSEECECCDGEGVHMTEGTTEVFGIEMEGILIRACNFCQGTGRIVGFCTN